MADPTNGLGAQRQAFVAQQLAEDPTLTTAELGVALAMEFGTDGIVNETCIRRYARKARVEMGQTPDVLEVVGTIRGCNMYSLIRATKAKEYTAVAGISNVLIKMYALDKLHSNTGDTFKEDVLDLFQANLDELKRANKKGS